MNKFVINQLKSSIDITQEDIHLMDNISLNVHPYDTMFAGNNIVHYLSVGLSATKCIEYGMKHKNKQVSDIHTVLDFPSGYGRVLRFLCIKFNNSTISAGEIDNHALSFCKSAFGVNTILSNKNFDTMNIKDQFDLIWCGSLLTHLNFNDTKSLLTLLYDCLQQNGIAYITTHGEQSAQMLTQKITTYGIPENHIQTVIDSYRTDGFGYADYMQQDRYGISIVRPDFMRKIFIDIGFDTEVLHINGGWDNHQDVYIVSKGL